MALTPRTTGWTVEKEALLCLHCEQSGEGFLYRRLPNQPQDFNDLLSLPTSLSIYIGGWLGCGSLEGVLLLELGHIRNESIHSLEGKGAHRK